MDGSSPSGLTALMMESYWRSILAKGPLATVTIVSIPTKRIIHVTAC
jgi:hypothetical protein